MSKQLKWHEDYSQEINKSLNNLKQANDSDALLYNIVSNQIKLVESRLASMKCLPDYEQVLDEHTDVLLRWNKSVGRLELMVNENEGSKYLGDHKKEVREQYYTDYLNSFLIDMFNDLTGNV